LGPKKPQKDTLIDHVQFNQVHISYRRDKTISVVKESVQNESVRFVFL